MARVGVIISFLTLQLIPILFTSPPKPKIFLPASMESFNIISTAAATRAISTASDLEHVLDAAKGNPKGADMPLNLMGTRPATHPRVVATWHLFRCLNLPPCTMTP
jgi:hypothetical protein